MRSSGMTWAAYKKHRDRGEYDDYEREQASSLSVVDKDEETRRRYQQYVQGVMASNYQDDIIRNQMMAPYLAEEERRRREEERQREEWQREHIAAQREQVQDGQSVANFDTQAARRKAEPKIRYEQAYDNWNAQNPEYKDKTAEEKYSLFAKELDEQNKLADASQGYRDFYNRNKKDPEFQRMSDDEKRRQYNHYLDQTLQDNGTLPEEQRAEHAEYMYNGLTDKEKALMDTVMRIEGEDYDAYINGGEQGVPFADPTGRGAYSQNRYNEASQAAEARKAAREKTLDDIRAELRHLGWSDEKIDTEFARYTELEDWRKTQESRDKYNQMVNDPALSGFDRAMIGAGYTAADVLSFIPGSVDTAIGYAAGDSVYGANTSTKHHNMARMAEEGTSQVRNNLIGDEHPVGQALYDIGVSWGESMSSKLLGAALGPAGEDLSLLPFAISSSDVAYRDAVNRGFSQNQATAYAVTVGALEALTEKLPMDRWQELAKNKKWGRNIFTTALTQMGIEGAEELVNGLGAQMADQLAVTIGNTGKTQARLDIEEMMAQGMSEEEAKTAWRKQFAQQLAMDVISGAAAAGPDVAVAAGVRSFRSRYGNNLNEAISDRYKNLKVEGDTAFENNLREEKAKYENNPVQYIADHYKVNSEEDAQVKQALQEIAEKEKEGKKLSVSDKSFITENVLANRDQFNQEYLDTLFDTGEDSIVPYKYRDVKTEVTEDQARTMLAEAAQSGDPKAFIDAQRKVRNSTVDEVAKHAEELIDFYAGSAMEHGITKEDIGKALIAEKQAYIAGITGEELNKDNLTPEAQIAYNDGKMDALKEATRTTIENKDALNTDVTTKEGNTVTLKGVFTSDGIMTDGGAVTLDKIDLDENKATNKAYQYADNYQSINLKNAFLNNIKEGQNIENYKTDFGKVFDSALAGVSLENLKKGAFMELDDEQIDNIYGIAQVERGARAANSIAEVLNGVKGNRVGKLINSSSTQDAKMLNTAELLAVATNYDIQLVDPGTQIEITDENGKKVKVDARGTFLKNQNRIIVRTDEFNEAVLHEIGHYVETYNKAEYDNLRNAVVNFAVEKMGMDRFAREFLGGYTNSYHAIKGQEELQADDISGEMLNDVIPAIMGTKQGQKALVDFLTRNYEANEARTIGQQLADFMKGIGKAVKNLFGKGEYDKRYARELAQYGDELGQFADQFIKALDGAIQNYNKGAQGESAGVQGDSETRFSLSEDSAGRELSEGQQEYFNDESPLLMKDGALKRYYHGTARMDRVGTVFRPERATSGPMAFFTDDKSIAENYAKDKSDTSLSRDERYDSYYTQFRMNINGKDVSVPEAWNMLPYSKKAEIKKKAGHIAFDDDYEEIAYYKDKTKGNGAFTPYELNRHKGNYLETLVDTWLDTGDLIDREEDFLKVLELVGLDNVEYLDPDARNEGVYEVYIHATNPLDTSNIPKKTIKALKDAAKKIEFNAADIQADMWDKNNVRPEVWISRLEDDIKNGTTHSWTSIPDWVTEVLKAQGYDAISDRGGKGGGTGHQVVIPFASNQVKSVDNLTPTEHEDIRFSIEDDDRVYYVRGTEVVKNPTDSEYQQMREDIYKERPWMRNMPGEPLLRHTYDEEGNTYYWDAARGIHAFMEPEINKHWNTRTSQHWEWWKKPDKDTYPIDYSVRYSIGGIKGAESEGLKRLAAAQDMEAEGKSEDEIWQETGWYRGTEGKWRFEIPDDDAKVVDYAYKENRDLFLDDVLKHDKLFKLYPFLRNIHITFNDDMGDSVAYYTNKKNSIVLGNEFKEAHPGDEKLKAQLKPILMHEIQHAIQNAEIFARGSSTSEWAMRERPVYTRGDLEEYKKASKILEEVKKDTPNAVVKGVENIHLLREAGLFDQARVEERNLKTTYGDKFEKYDDAYFDAYVYKPTETELTPYEAYEMTAGEIEAYDVENRLNLAPGTRKMVKPKTTTDKGVLFAENKEDPWHPGARFSLSKNSNGDPLSEGQQKYFQNSQALDEEGRLLSLYHGTPNAGFTIFKPGTRGGTWLTTSREDADSYAGYTGKEFTPGEKAETIKTISGQYAIGDKFFFDTKEDRDAFLKKHPNADNAISEAEYEANRWDDEFEDRWEESREVWKDYYRYEKEHLSNTDVWEVIDHPDRYTIADLKRAWLEYDSNAAFDDEFDYTESRYKEILAEGLKDALEEIGGREQPFNVRVRLPKGTQGEIQRNVNNRIYSVYANVENPAILDAQNTDIAYKLGYDAIEEALNDDRYDGVIVKNARQGAYKKPATIVITKNAEQVKLTSNLNPTSSKDIRFSFEDEGGWIDFDEVLGESMSEEKAVDILEKGMEALKNKDVDVPKLRTLALKIRNEYGSSYNANKLADDLRKAFAYMQTEDHVDYQTMMGILKDIARPVIEEAGEKVGEEEYKHFLEYFKGKKIKLTSTQKEEVRHTFGSYGAYRNAMMPITISDNGEFTLDQLWDEMVQHGGYMLDIDANEGDMPINLLDTLQAMRPYVRNDFGGDTEDLAKDLAMRIVEEYIQGESAKEMHKELTEYRNRLKKDYQERLKDLKGRANAEVLARNKRRAEEKAERQKARDLKVKIKQNANKLYTWAVKPTEGKSVPHNMMVPVMQFLQGIDFVDPVITVSDDGKYHIRLFDRVDYEDGHKKFIYKDLVGDTREDVLRQFNEAIGRGEGTKEQRSWTDKMQGIRDIYNKVLNDTDFEDTDMDFLMQTLDAQGLAEEFDDLLSRHKGQASMNSLSSKELELINNIIQNIFHAVNQGNKAFSQPSVDIVNLAQSTMKDAEGKEIKSRNRFMEGLHKMLRLDNVTPRTFFKLLGKRGSEVYKFLRGGLNQEIIDLKKASEFMEEAMKGIDAKTWTGRSATIHEIPVSEGTIRLTDAQIMGLYMTIRRNGGKDRIKGGVKIDDIRTKGRPIQQKAMHLTDTDIEKIEAILTPEQIALAKKMQQYMAKDCSEQGNDTSMRLYGFKKFTDDTYYPWTVDKDTVATTNTSENIPMFTGIERSGFTKQLKEGATNPLVIRDIFDVFTDHVSQMAAYHGYAASVKDTLRWMNYRERSDADGFVNWHTNKKAINDLTGSKQGVGYIRNLLLDINKANKSQYIGNFTDLLIGNYKAAAVGANLRVVAQQPTAYFRALNMIDPKYLLTVNPATAIKNIKRSQEQSPISWWKSKGYYETNLGQPIKEIVTGITSPAEKAKDIMMAPAGWADDFTWGFLYTAVEKEQRDLLKGQNLTAEQFRQAVNDRFDEVVDNTQVVDSTLHRSQYMRSTDRLNKIQTAFMAEPTKSYNMLLEAFLEDRNDKSGKRTTRAIAAFLLSSLATSAAAAVVDAMRKAKDDEDWWEVWLKNLQENAADNINPFNLLPVVKDVSAGIYNLLTGTSTFGQSGNRFDIEAISSIMSAVQMIPKLIEGESNKTGYGAALTMIKPISQITGIPVYNLTKDTVALYNTFFDNIETTINSGSTAKNEKKKSFVSDVNRERSEETLDEGIVDAIENGVSIYDLKGAVRSEYKNKYFDAYAEGNTEEAQAIAERAARAYARMGMSDEDIDAEINEWQEETITYALLDKAIASGEGIEDEIRHVQEGKADEKIIKHIMDRFSDTIAYEDVHETESDWRGNVEKALQAIDPTLTYDTANEEAMQKKAEKEAEQAAQEEKKGYKADFFASVESKNGTAGRKALDGLKAMGVDAKSAKTMVSTQYHDAWKEAKTPAEKQKAKSDWMSAYKLVCNYYGVEYKDLDKTWVDWEKDQ